MPRGIFGKVFTTYLILIFLTLFLGGLFAGQVIENNLFADKRDMLLAEGKNLEHQVERYIRGELNPILFSQELMVVDRVLNARIWIVDKNGLIFEASSIGGEDWTGARLRQEEMARILRGETVFQIGRFGERFDAAMLSVGLPLTVGNRIEGAVFLHSPVYGLRATFSRLLRYIWLVAGLAALLALVLSYALSSAIAKPIQQMGQLAKEVAHGEFSGRLPVHGRDEVADLARDFNSMVEKLSELEEMRREFVANVSHELRSPLTSLQGFLQAILDGAVPAGEEEKYLQIAFHETQRLSRLVEDLLDLARLEGGVVRFAKEPFDVAEEGRQAALRLLPQFEAKQVEVDFDFAPEPLLALGDAARTAQVLTNLLDNALRFSPAGSRVKVSGKLTDQEVMVTVADQGEGIPEEELPRIWQRFYKRDKARTVGRGGTGLGLSIVKLLVEAQGGRVWVTSRPGHGAAFSFSLPRAQS